jgi:hypothetical protein
MAKTRVSKIEIRNTPEERELLDKIKDRYGFDEDELHLFCWYIGFRMCAEEYLGITMSEPPTETAVREFIKRQKTH